MTYFGASNSTHVVVSHSLQHVLSIDIDDEVYRLDFRSPQSNRCKRQKSFSLSTKFVYRFEFLNFCIATKIKTRNDRSARYQPLLFSYYCCLGFSIVFFSSLLLDSPTLVSEQTAELIATTDLCGKLWRIINFTSSGKWKVRKRSGVLQLRTVL